MRTSNCTKCGTAVTLNATKCYNCGNNIAVEKKFVKWFIIFFIIAVIYVEFIEGKTEDNNVTNQTIQRNK